MDVIYLVSLQKEIELLLDPLINIFRSFLALDHVLKAWKIARAVFISKVGKPSNEGVKDYRPFRLIFFVLKTRFCERSPCIQ